VRYRHRAPRVVRLAVGCVLQDGIPIAAGPHAALDRHQLIAEVALPAGTPGSDLPQSLHECQVRLEGWVDRAQPLDGGPDEGHGRGIGRAAGIDEHGPAEPIGRRGPISMATKAPTVSPRRARRAAPRASATPSTSRARLTQP